MADERGTTKDKLRALASRDGGVSPVIAVILMVAITVVLAATVYVWVSGFASEQSAPEQASATATGVDLNDDGDVEWVKVTLTEGEDAPYDFPDVTINGSSSDGTGLKVCQTAVLTGGDCDDWFNNPSSGDAETWGVGDAKWVPCEGSSLPGNTIVSASVRDTAILDAEVTCDATP